MGMSREEPKMLLLSLKYKEIDPHEVVKIPIYKRFTTLIPDPRTQDNKRTAYKLR